MPNHIEEGIYQNLRASRHFKGISDKALQRLLHVAEYKRFHDQEQVIEQGVVYQVVHIIINGKALVKVDEQLIYTLQRTGDVIGETSLVKKKAASAISVEAWEFLETIQISAKFLNNVRQDVSDELHSIFYHWFSYMLSDKLHLATQKAQLYETPTKTISQKNQEVEHRIHELNIVHENIRSTQMEREEAKKLTALTKTFQKFVPKHYLNRISQQGTANIKVGSGIKDFITVLFADIREFTNLCEHMTPEEVFRFLSSYLSRMSEPIHQHGGVIDKFIGDAIMAIFNRPKGTDEEEAKGAIQAALGLQKALTLYNEHRSKQGYPALSIGVGIHSGPVMMGTVGSNKRMDFTVIGDTVNLASRLESLTKYYEVSCIISQTTYRLVDLSPYHVRELDTVQVKGRTEKVVIFELFSGCSTELMEAKNKLLIPYNHGLIHFQLQEWKEAIHLFQECLRILPKDRASQLYLERCQYFQLHPPPYDWDHVFKLDKK